MRRGHHGSVHDDGGGKLMKCSSAKRRRGSVLVVALWIALGLVAIGVYFGHAMVMEYRVSANRMAGVQAQHAVEGARRYISFILEEIETAGEMPDEEDYEYENVPVDDAVFWLVGREDEDLLLESDEPAFGLIDEASKLNLNTATQEMLEALPYMTTELAASIIDWRDTDSDLTANGAESETYLLLDPAYNAKDSGFETPGELRLVYGADFELLYGEDVNLNGVLDANEDDGDASYPDDDANGELRHGLLEYVTTFSRQPNTQEDGSARVNLQEDSDESSQGGQGETRGQDNGPAQEKQDSSQQQSAGQEQSLEDLLTETFGDARGQEIAQAVSAQSSSINSVLEFYILSGMTEDEFVEIESAVTTSDDDYVQGLINVETASREVLACIPGIGEEFADELISAREARDSDAEATVAWVAEVLPQENAIAAGPYLTAESYVFSADIAALGLHGRGLRRNLIVFDTAGDEVTVVYRQDLSRLGWPLGDTTYEALRDSEDEGDFEL